MSNFIGTFPNATFTRSSMAYKSNGAVVSNNIPRYESGKFGKKALQFNGTSSYIHLGNPSSFDVNTFTIEAWVKIGGSNFRSLFGGFNGAETKNYVTIDSSGVIALDQYAPSGGQLYSKTKLVVGNWYHIAVTQSATSRKIYINGNIDIQDNTPETYSGGVVTSWRIGMRDHTTTKNYFGGCLYDVRYWSVERTAAEIQACQNGIVGNELGLIGWWKLDEGIGNKTTDSGPYGNYGTIYDGVWTDGQALGIKVEEGTTNLILNSDFEVMNPTKQRVFFDDFNRTPALTFTRSGSAINPETGNSDTGARYISGRFQNLLTKTQSDIEADSTGWSLNGYFSRVTDKAWQGSASLKFSSTSAINTAANIARINVTPGKTYIFSAYGWISSTKTGNNYLDWMEYSVPSGGTRTFDGDGGTNAMWNGQATDTWVRRWCVFTPTQPYVELRVVCDNNSIGDAWFDGFQFEEAITNQTSPTAWRSGGSGKAILIEEGTTNIVTNPSFEVDSNTDGLADGWNIWVRGTGDATRTHNKTRVTSLFGTGYAQRIEITGGVTNTSVTSLENPAGNEIIITAGQTYAFSAYVRASVANKVQLSFRWEDSSATYLGDSYSTVYASTTTQRISVIAQAPANAAKVRLQICGINTQGEWFEVDCVQVENKSYVTSWTNSTRTGETLSVPITSLLPSAGTFEQWVYVNNSSKRQVAGQYNRLFLIQKSIGLLYGGIQIMHDAVSSSWIFTTYDDADSTTSINVPDSETPDGWHLFTITWNISNAKLYIDGVLKATIVNPKLPSAFQNIYIGSQHNGACANTYHDAIRVSNAVRTDTEILAYYNTTDPISQLDDKTIFMLNFDSDLDAEATVQAGWAGISSPSAVRVKGGKLLNVNGYTVTHGDSEWTDIDISAKVTCVQGSEAQLYVRFIDSNNHFRLGITGGTNFVVMKQIAGTKTTLFYENAILTLGTEYTIRATVIGNTLTVYLNGVQKYSNVITDAPTSGKIGLQTWVSTNDSVTYFDDIEVKIDVPDWWTCRSGGWASNVDALDRFGFVSITNGYNSNRALKKISVPGYSNTQNHTDFRTGYIDSVPANTTYTISFFIKGNISGGSGFRVYFQPKDSNSTTLATVSALTIPSLSDTWTKYTATYTTITGTSRMLIWLTLTPGTQGWYAVDCIQLEQKEYATSYHRNNSTTLTSSRSSEVLSIPTTNMLPPQGTWEQWVYIDNNARRQISGQFNRIFHIPYTDNSIAIAVYHDPITAYWKLETRNNSGVGTSAAAADSYTPDGWHLFTVSWDLTVAKLYIDGALRATINNPNLVTTFGTQAAIGSTLSGSYSNTIHDSVRVSNIVRSDAEISNVYNSNQPFVSDKYTVANYRFGNNFNSHNDVKAILMSNGDLHLRSQLIQF